MGILDYIDESEYAAWQRAKKRNRQQQQQLAGQRYAQPEPTPWQQAFQPVQEEPMVPPAQGPGYYAAPELPAAPPPLSRPQPMQLAALRPPQGPVAPSAGMAISHESQQQTPGDVLGQLGQGARQKMGDFQEFIDRPWLRGLLTVGDLANPLTQRGQLARSAYLMDRDAQRQYDIAREQAMEGGFQGLLPEGPVRGAAGLAGDVLHNAVFKDEPVYAPSPHPVAVPSHRPVGETFAEAWQRWSHEKENPVVEMAGSLSNPLGWLGPVEALQAGRVAVQGAKALAPSLKAVPKLAREVGPAAKAVAKDIGEAIIPVAQDMRLRPEAGELRLAGEAGEPAPTFYSQLERTLSEAKQSKWQPGELRNFLKAQGVKDEELKWTGFDDYVLSRAQAKQPVTKDEALQFLRENQVEVQEVVKGDINARKAQLIDEIDAARGTEREQSLQDELMRLQQQGAGGQAKFAQHTLPGAQEGSYRELLLTLPVKPISLEKWQTNRASWGKPSGTIDEYNRLVSEGGLGNPEGRYQSGHFPEPDILAHIRFNDRVDAAGKKTLFIEEIQSDWHQAGRQKGYKDGKIVNVARAPEEAVRPYENIYTFSDGVRIGANDEREALAEYVYEKTNALPDAPFKKTWPELALKRMVRWASVNGYDRVAWTRGAQQAERYDLRKQLDALRYIKRSDGSYVLYGRKGGSSVIEIPQEGGSIPANKLEDYVGKEVAQRIIEGAGEPLPNSTTARELSGLDLRVGGQGMLAFYDRELVNVANNLGKKFGARVGETNITVGKPKSPYTLEPTRNGNGFTVMEYLGGGHFRTASPDLPYEEAKAIADEMTAKVKSPIESVHSIDITPAMRESVVYKGQSLFMAPETVGGTLGAATGYAADENATPEERLRNTLLGAGIGATGGHLVRPGAAQRLGQTAKALHLDQRGAVGDLEGDVTKDIAERGYRLASRLPDNPEFRSIVERTLARAQENGRPAVVMDNVVYLPDGKYVIGQQPGGKGRLELQKIHDLSPEGLLRGLESNYDSTGEWASYNRTAQEMVEGTKAKRAEERAAEEAQKLLEREARDKVQAEYLANRQALDEQMKVTKFKKLDAPIKLANGQDTILSGPSIGGLIVHKQIGIDPKYAKYTVSAMGSGVNLGLRFETQTQARVAAMRLSSLIDWTRAGEEITDEIKQQVVPYIRAMRSGDAYATVEKALPITPMGERPAAEVLREKGLPVPGEEAVAAGLEAETTPTKQAGMFQPGEARPQMKGAIAGETMQPEDLLGAPQFEDEAARAKWEREQQVARGQTEMFGEGAAVAPQSAEVAKQPWEMTLAELNRTGYIAYDTAANQPFVKASASIDEATNASEHQRVVAKALSEGKPVPHDVISEYPDLAAQYKGAGETAITEPTPLPPAEAALAATGQGAVPIETPLATAPETPALAEIAPTPKPAVDPLQAEYAKVLAANPRIGQYMRYLNQTYVKTNSPLKGFARYMDDAGNVFVARNSKEGKLNYYRVDKTGKAVPVSKAGAEWREVSRSGEMPAGVHAEAVTEKPFAVTAVKVIPEGYPANTTAKQLAYIQNMQESLDAKKIAGVRVYMDNRGHLFVERISNGGKGYAQQVKLDGTARDVRKGANWTLLEENMREVARPTTQMKVPKPPRSDEEIEAAIRARQATARKPLWAQDEMQAKALETEMPPASTGGQGPPKPPEPPTETGPAPELPSGRQPGGIEKQTEYTPEDSYQQLQEALKPDKEPAVVKANRFMRQWYDDNFDYGALEQKSGLPVHKLAQLTNGAVAAGEADLQRHYVPILKTLKGKEDEALQEWMVLQRSRDILAKNPSAKLPNNINGVPGIAQAEKALAASIGPEAMVRVQNAARGIWALNKKVPLAILKEHGVLDDEMIRKFTTTHPHYIPFNRLDYSVMDELEKAMKPKAESVAASGIEFLSKTGSEMKLDHPLDNLLGQVIRAQRIAWRNRAANTLVDALTAMQAKTGEEWIQVLKPGDKLADTNTWGSIAYFRDGKLTYAKVPKVYADIANGAEAEALNAMVNFFNKISSPLRAGAITYNAGWAPTNLTMDAIGAFYREGLVPFSPEWWRGMKAAVTRNEDWYEAAKGGAFMSGLAENTIGSDPLKRARRLRMGTIGVKDWKGALTVLPRILERAGEASEQGSRTAVFHKLKEQGLDLNYVGVHSRDASFDFSKSGSLLRLLNAAIPFSNAGVQGAANTLRLFKDNIKQAMIGLSAISMPSILAFVWNQRFETADMIPDYVYARSWPFIIGEGTEAPDPRRPDSKPQRFPIVLPIPKGPTGATLTAPIELALRLAWVRGDRSVLEHFAVSGKQLMTGLLPIDPSISGIFPPLGSTLAGLATGRDMWRGEDIVPRREQARPPELQYGPETSRPAIAVGERFNVSPRLLDFAVKDYTAALGQQGLWLGDLILGALGYNPTAPGEARRQPLTEVQQLARTPVISRFLSTRNTQQERLGYERLDRIVEQGRRDYMAIPEVRRMGMSLSPVSEAIKVGERDVEMSPAQRAEFQREYNATRITGVQAMIDSSLYQKAPSDKFKQALLERMNRQAGELARDNAALVAQGQAPELTPAQLQTEIREYVQALHENAQLLTIPKYRSVPPEKEKVVTSIKSRVSAIKAAEPRYSPAGAENQARKEGRFSDEDWKFYMQAKGNLNPERQRFVREHPIYRKWFRGAAEEYLQLRTAS